MTCIEHESLLQEMILDHIILQELVLADGLDRVLFVSASQFCKIDTSKGTFAKLSTDLKAI